MISATWINPTEYRDGRPLMPDLIAGYRFYCNRGTTNERVIEAAIGVATQYQFAADVFPPGQNTCEMAMVTIENEEGELSAMESFVVPELGIGPVTNFQITVA